MPQVDGKQIKDAPNGVATAKINDLAVTEGKIANSAVTNGKIANQAVDEFKLHTSVAGNGLVGGNGTPLAVGATPLTSAISVSADAIAVNIKATGALEIEATGQGELDVKDGGIDANRLATDAVTNAKIADQAVDTAELADGAVTPTKADLTVPWSFTADNLQVTTAPDSANDAVNKAYVDGVAQGLKVKESCRAKSASTAELSGYTFTGGEWTGVTAAPTFDGVTLADQERVLIQHGDADLAYPGNGIFYYDDASDKLIRTLDANTWDELVSAFVFIEEGSTLADTGWVCTIDSGGTLDVTDITWSQFSGAGTYTAGAGITLTGTQFSITEIADSAIDVQGAGGGLKVAIDDSTIGINAGTPGNIYVKNGGITETQLNTSVAGDGIDGGGGTPLSVNVSEIAGNGLESDGGSPANLRVKPDVTNAGPSVAVDANGVRAAVPYISDKEKAGVVTTGNDYDTGLTVAQTPAHPSYVRVSVNGVAVTVGDNVTTKECYFSSDGTSGGVRAISAIAAGDHLVWNGTIAGYQLATSDIIDFEYDYAA